MPAQAHVARCNQLESNITQNQGQRPSPSGIPVLMKREQRRREHPGVFRQGSPIGEAMATGVWEYKWRLRLRVRQARRVGSARSSDDLPLATIILKDDVQVLHRLVSSVPCSDRFSPCAVRPSDIVSTSSGVFRPGCPFFVIGLLKPLGATSCRRTGWFTRPGCHRGDRLWH